MPLLDVFINLTYYLSYKLQYLFIFLFSFVESIPVFGLAVPGQSIIILAGFLAKEGALDIGDVLLFSSLGAIVGDSIGFYIGRKYGFDFLAQYGKYFFLKKDFLDEVKDIVHKHPGKALIIGRQWPAIRSLVPYTVGSSNISYARFLFFNVIGGVSWAAISVLGGYLFGLGYEVASKYIGGASAGLILLLIIGVYIYRFIVKRTKKKFG